jgi:hypothetical protein
MTGSRVHPRGYAQPLQLSCVLAQSLQLMSYAASRPLVFLATRPQARRVHIWPRARAWAPSLGAALVHFAPTADSAASSAASPTDSRLHGRATATII